ncbi:BspA family leucine-rich repeat surface protein [Lactiplantibacillus dongliensis]|uniref:BspA family leucine-rich repeat surface protein n=1 Tax=Lactiplantibacillus dongliensis TaxID=2559919 RepID=A0ABW1RAA3_9LACO|nr:BspA family leucine-rich repeat surface protein [Lactiplantibacillus dongliensis]
MLKSNDRKVRFKLYKQGKLWVITGITALVWQAGAIVGQADTVKPTVAPTPVTVKSSVDQPGKTAVLRATVPDKQPAKAPEKPDAGVADNIPTTKPAVPSDKQPTVDTSQQAKQPAKDPDTPKPTTPDQPAGNKPNPADSKPTTQTAPEKPVSNITDDTDKPESPATDDANQGDHEAIPNDVKQYDDYQKPVKIYTGEEIDPHDHKTNRDKGIFGTSEWWVDDDQILHIGEGKLADTNIWNMLQPDDLGTEPEVASQRDATPLPWGTETNNITTITFEGPVVAGKDASGLFSNMTSLATINDIDKFDTSQVTNMGYLFSRDESLTSLDLSHFKTDRVTNMQSTFFGLTSIKDLDLTPLNTSNVTRMAAMLASNVNLVKVDLSKLNTSHVTDMSSLFMSDEQLEHLDLTNFDTSQVTDMSYMFNGLTNLKDLNVSTFNTSKVIDMYSMFEDTAPNQSIAIDISNFDMTNVSQMPGMLATSPLKITLGANSVLTLDSYYFDQDAQDNIKPQTSGLYAFSKEDVHNGNKYTGKWFDTKTHQVYTTEELVKPYTGKGSGPATTYQQQSNLEVQDSTIRVNSKWQPSNNLISATDDDGSNVTFKKDRRQATMGPQLSVYDQPNTQIPGNYTVVYNLTDSVGFQAIRKSKIIVTGLILNETEKQLSTTAPWEPLNNVKLAVDAQGNTVTTTGVTATIVNDQGHTVTNFRILGQYVVHYQLTGDDASVVEMPLTVFSLAKVTPKDTAIKLGTTWQASDNFNAVDENGKALTLTSPGVKVVGTPDTQTPGNYPITYTYTDAANHAVSATAKVTVAGILLKQAHLQLVTTANWQPQTNLKTAVNANGQRLTATDLQITVTNAKTRTATAATALTKQLTAPGTYLVSYQFTDKLGRHQATTLVTVTSQATVNATDQTIHIGDTWQPQAGFVSGTNEHGQSLAWAAITVTGQVNPAQAGQYPITYSYTDAAGNVTAKAVTVTVLGTTTGGGDNGNNGNNNGGNSNGGGHGSSDNGNDGTSPETKPQPTPTEPEQPTQSEDAGVIPTPAGQPSPAKVTPVKPISLVSPTLPQTDENTTTPLSIMGIAGLALSSLVAMFKFAKKP